MRLVYTTDNAEQARILASFLSSEGIENQLEMVKKDDWGEHDYGDMLFRVWTIDEDAAEAAEKWVEAFEKDPQNPMFQRTGSKTTVIPSIVTDTKMNQSGRNDVGLKPEPVRTITSGLIMLCCIFYLIASLTAPHVTSIPAGFPGLPIISAPIKKQFYYDYPKAFELVDRLVKLYGVEKLQTPESLPPEGQYLLKEFQNTPYWQGIYDWLVAYFKGAPLPQFDAPMFEKIRQGEVWRLFTPAIMHGEFLHILFNMIWLIVLGKQLEERLQARRYLLFILITGIFSNTCQYLMGGPSFLGFSGVICAMLTFIIIRQKIAPWEGYPLETGISMFALYFIIAALAMQIVSFYLEVYHNSSFTTGIGNTAHLSGAIIGALLAFLPFFRKRPTWQGR